MPRSGSFPALCAGFQETDLRTHIAAAEVREWRQDGVSGGLRGGLGRKASQVHPGGGWSWRMQKIASLLRSPSPLLPNSENSRQYGWPSNSVLLLLDLAAAGEPTH